MNSRQCRIVLGDDLWVQNTLKAVHYAIDMGWEIVTSIGLKNHELVLWAVAEFGGRAMVIVPRSAEPSHIVQEFEMEPRSVELQVVSGKGRSWWRARDRAIFEAADVLIPVSVRENGNFDGLLKEFSAAKPVIDRFRVDYNPDCSGRFKKPVAESIVNPPNWNHLVHWVHTTFEPLPHETKRDFFKKIVNSGHGYPYSAFSNLKSILNNGMIYGSPSFRSGVRGVSFTSLPPSQSAQFMKWRPSKTRYYWEPYGVAIRTDVAIELGIQQVIYGDENDFKKLKDELKPYFQPYGRENRWVMEHEYRFIGDFSLRKVPTDALLILVNDEDEALEVETLYGFMPFVIQK